MRRSFENQFDIDIDVIDELQVCDLQCAAHDDYTEYLETHMDYSDDYSEASLNSNIQSKDNQFFALSVINKEIERKLKMSIPTSSHTDQHADGPVHTDVE